MLLKHAEMREIEMIRGIEAIDAPLGTGRTDGTVDRSLMARRDQVGTSKLSRTAAHPQRTIKFVVDLSALGVEADLKFEIHVDAEPKVKISTVWGQGADTDVTPKKCPVRGKPSDRINFDRAENRVRELREKKLLTQSQLARKAGLASRTIHNVENGMTCRIGTKRKILLGLGISYEDRDMVFPPMQHSVPMISATNREHGLVSKAVCITQSQPEQLGVPDRSSLFSEIREIAFHERGE